MMQGIKNSTSLPHLYLPAPFCHICFPVWTPSTLWEVSDISSQMLTLYFSNVKSVPSCHPVTDTRQLFCAQKCLHHTHWGGALSTGALAPSCWKSEHPGSVSQEQSRSLPLRWLPLCCSVPHIRHTDAVCAPDVSLVMEEKYQVSDAFAICHFFRRHVHVKFQFVV